jgi:hypothetical protein
MLAGYHFYSPCGQARICGDLPAANANEQPGYYLVYVLNDSLDVNTCVSAAEMKDTLRMRFGRDFLMAAAVHDTRPDWVFNLQHMEIVDSMLHIHLEAHHGKDSKQLSDSYVWRINGQGVKLIKLYVSNSNYAYVQGPQWSEEPVNWEHAHWRESTVQ